MDNDTIYYDTVSRSALLTALGGLGLKFFPDCPDAYVKFDAVIDRVKFVPPAPIVLPEADFHRLVEAETLLRAVQEALAAGVSIPAVFRILGCHDLAKDLERRAN